MQAAICMLECYSPEEISVVVNPVQSFFTTSYAQCTKYAKQLTKLEVYGQHMFSGQLDIPLNKADMIGRLYIMFTLPPIRHWKEAPKENENSKFCEFDNESDSEDSCSSSDESSKKHKKNKKRHHGKHSSSSSSSSSDSSEDKEKRDKDYYVYWNNDIAHVLVQSLDLYCGTTPIVKHDGEYLEIRDEFSNKPGCSTDSTVGRHNDEDKIWAASRREQKRVVRARFHFCENIGKSLAVFTLRKSRMFARLTIRDLKECYVSSDKTPPYLLYEDVPLRNNDISVDVYANVYHLTAAERAQIFNDEHVYLMHQLQKHEVDLDNRITAQQMTHKITLPFRHLVTGFKFAIQDDAHRKNKNWFNYAGIGGRDPLHTFKLTIGGKDLTPEMPGFWQRTIEVMEGHTNIPKNRHVYSCDFSICPEDETFTSGFINMTALQNSVVMHLKLQRGLGPNVTVKIWANTINLFRIDNNGEVSLGWLEKSSQ